MLAKQPRAVYSTGHEQFRETVRRYFKEAVEPRIKDWEKAGGLTRELFTEAATYGILCPGLPEEYGGGGGDFLHHAIVHEESGYTVAGANIGGGLGIDGSSYLWYYAGTEEQKRAWIPRYAKGEVICETAYTEPHSGSDMKDVRTYARRDGSDYIVNGHKIWVTNGPICTHFATSVAIELPDGKKGQAVLMIDADAPGVTVSKPIRTLHHGSSMEAEVWFSDVRVPAERLLGGKEDGALRDAVRVLIDQRLAEAARFLAAAEYAFDMTVEYTQNRHAFGQRIFDFQNTQFKLADMLTRLKVLRPFVDECLARTLDGSLTNVESSMAKLACSEAEFEIIDQCLQLHGGMGFAHDMPISQLWTFARIHRVYLGTSEIHRVGIARSIR